MKKAIGIILALFAGFWLITLLIYQAVGDNSEPSIKVAPYVVQTYSKYYFAKQVTGTPPDIKMTGYYYLQNEKWVYHKGSLTFNANWPAQVQRR